MEKYALIRQKRDDEIAKRTERKNRRTFPPSIFQLNPIIAPIIEPIEEPILEPILEPIDELVLLIEEQPLNVLNEDPIEDIPDIINPALIAQAEELRKLILLQETIKRFSKKKI
jgi:hypothetical protein